VRRATKTVAWISAALALAVLGAAPASAVSTLLPVRAPGDRIALKLTFSGKFPGTGKTPETTTAFDLLCSGPNEASIVVHGPQRDASRSVTMRSDGSLDGTRDAGIRALAEDYNALVSTVAHAPAGGVPATWKATLPVKISKTEWRAMPVTVRSTNAGDTTTIVATGTKMYPLYADGFSAPADVSISFRGEFDHGAFVSATLRSHEVVHALDNIDISYEWTMSKQP
jgi:hypothetical protein